VGLDRMVPVPKNNPLTKVRIDLGRDLFFDPSLSRDGEISCASCHKPEFAFADDQPLSLGIKGRQGQRNTPTVLNAAYHRQLFWDGRVNSLEDQAKQPIFNHAEMGIDNETMLIDRLKNKYHERFRQVFGQPISLQTVAKALACYERTLLSGDSDFDRYEGGNRDALLPSAVRGRALFFGKAGCGHCHIPPLFTDYKFHNLGIGWDGAKFADAGRYKVTEFKKDRGTFKTPSLRDVTRTGPYMHDGSIPTLRKVIEFYNMGGHTNPTLDSQMKTLSLTEKHIDDIVAFLHSLEGRYKVEIRPAQSPPAPKKAP
jgi:cytochrome c peroxidase